MNIGDYIEVKTAKESFKGILMPESTNNYLVLKLNSGYNIGIDKKKIKLKKVLKKQSTKKEKKLKITNKKSLSKISILHTGGTIASKVDYETGGVIAKFTPSEILETYPELSHLANIDTRLIRNMQSESLRFEHYNLIAREILKEVKKKVKGIIITHGTDTLHYTAAALALILDKVNIPIILVGSQRSSDRGSSDAYLNLYCATKFIAKSNFKGVAICMHSNSSDDSCDILPSLKSRKMHTSRRDAFKPINSEVLATVSKEGKVQSFFNKKEVPGTMNAKFIKKDLKIGILKSHTCLFPEDFLHFKNHDGLIIEGTGLGHVPAKSFDPISKINDKNKKAIETLAKKIPVVMTSQCIFGRVNMNIYSPQRELLEIGIIPGSDMTTETAFLKLAWLLSNNKKKARELIQKDLKGEINPRIKNEFL
jgi:glutamyl-tRNA(Gln) amidotransferase subunit D